jgi:hypothetical protein
LRPERDGYRFVVALPPTWDFEEYLVRWHGWPKGLKRNIPNWRIPTKWSSEIVLGFRVFVGTYKEFSQADVVKENWQSINIC